MVLDTTISLSRTNYIQKNPAWLLFNVFIMAMFIKDGTMCNQSKLCALLCDIQCFITPLSTYISKIGPLYQYYHKKSPTGTSWVYFKKQFLILPIRLTNQVNNEITSLIKRGNIQILGMTKITVNYGLNNKQWLKKYK